MLIEVLISNELEEKLSMCRLFQSTNDDQRNRCLANLILNRQISKGESPFLL